MHSNSILSSSLLDIIFDNRNKDYGAYILRKEYNKRLFHSLVIVLALSVIFASWQIFFKKNDAAKVSFVEFIPDISVSSIKKLAEKLKKNIPSQAKPAKALPGKPVIVNNNLADKPVLPYKLVSASPGGIDPGAPPLENSGIQAAGSGGTETGTPIKSPTPVFDINVPIHSPEILPQYPGGIAELTKFLKRNLNTPRELEEGEKLTVKIRFVVNYKGILTGFDVVETGGEPFDNEVIRVLKKMPEWIPGKTKGENVSAYFIIPVIFTLSN